jgi:hypothetical protein
VDWAAAVWANAEGRGDEEHPDHGGSTGGAAVKIGGS